MKEIIWLGRGGQGAFTAAKLLGAAYTAENSDKYALAFPSFGPERRGAPVRAFTKLDTKPVTDRSQTEKADYIVILDDTLYSPQLKQLLKDDGRIIVNSKSSIDGALTFDGERISIGSIKGYMPEKIQERNIGALSRAVEEVLS